MNTKKLHDYVVKARATLDELDAEIGYVEPPPPSSIVVKIRPGDDVGAAIASLYGTGGVIAAYPGQYLCNVELAERAAKMSIVLTTDTTNLPAEGVRITPDYLPGLAVFRSANGLDAAFSAPRRTGGLSFLGAAFGAQVQDRTVISLGDDTMALASDMPTDFVFDRCLWVGDPVYGQHRGIMAHAMNVAVTGCYFQDMFEPGRDSQCIGAWNGGRNIIVDNCHLEGGAENIMCGGSDSKSAEMIPQDVRIVRNYFTKPVRWQSLAVPPSIKCLLEMKNIKRLHVEGNVFDGNWSAQKPGGAWASGIAVMFKISPDGCAWHTCEDVTFVNNVIRNVGAVLGIVGSRDGEPSTFQGERMKRVTIENNLAYAINKLGSPYVGTGGTLPIGNPPIALHVKHNTIHDIGWCHSMMNWWSDMSPEPGTEPGQDLQVTDNVLNHGEYGIHCSKGMGTAALNQGWPSSYQWSGNAIRRGPSGTVPLPTGNVVIDAAPFDASFNGHAILPVSDVGQVATTDGKLVGADVAVIQAALAPTERV